MLSPEAERVNEPWLVAVRRGRPYVTWKVAPTLVTRLGGDVRLTYRVVTTPDV